MLAKKPSLQKQDISEKIQYAFEVALVAISKGQIVISSSNCFVCLFFFQAGYG